MPVAASRRLPGCYLLPLEVSPIALSGSADSHARCFAEERLTVRLVALGGVACLGRLTAFMGDTPSLLP